MAAKSDSKSRGRPQPRTPARKTRTSRKLDQARRRESGRATERRALLVLGMHRSGTSAATRVCNLLGVDLGSKMMPPGPDNEVGFWEHEDIYLAHEKLLAELGSPWNDYRALPEGWQSHRAVAECSKQITAILDEELAHSSFWCVKDPRASRLVPLWLSVIQGLGCTPMFLLVWRNPLEVAGSLASRNSFPAAKSELLWLRHLIDAERDTRDHPRAFLTYEDLLQDWRRTMSRVAGTLNITWPKSATAVGAEIDRFLQARLRHQAVDDVVTESDRNLSRWVRDSYRAFKQAAGGDDAPLREILTATARELDAAAPLLDPWVRGLELDLAKTSGEIEDYKAQIGSLNDAAAAAEEALSEKQAEIDRMAGELAELREIVPQRDYRIGQLQNEISAAQEGILRRDVRIDMLSKQLSQSRDALAERDQALGSVPAALSSAREQVAERDARLAETVEELTKARADIAQREGQIEILSEQLSDLRGVAVERTHEADRMRTLLSREREHIAERDARLAEIMEALSKARSDIGMREARIEELSGELSRARESLAERERELESVQGAVSSARADLGEREAEIEALSGELSRAQQSLAEKDRRLERAEGELLRAQQENTKRSEALETDLRAALAERDAVIEAVFRSTSWRITGPLRAAKRGLLWLGRAPRTLAGRLARAVYHRLPISHTNKLRLKDTLYGNFGFLIRGTATYQHWREVRQKSWPGPTAALTPQGGLAAPSGDAEAAAASQLALTATPDDPLVSIIIPVYNQLDYTQRCLRSIQHHQSKYSAEVIVVDDGSQDATPDTLADLPGIRYVRNEHNQGFIRTCNRGASLALGDYLVFLNNDTEVLPGWLDELVGTFDIAPNVGLVGSKLLYPDGRLQEAGGIIWNDGSGWNYGRGDDPNKPEYNYLRDVDYVSGASIMVPKKLFEQLGGFDERYVPAYSEDSDLAFGIRELGCRTLYQPLSQVVHYEGVTSGTDVAAGTKRYQEINRPKFVEKWSHVLARSLPPGEDVHEAKERTINGRILVIDACTPTPDQDAGSLTAFSFMRIFRSWGCKVTFIPEDNLAYVDRYTPDLQRLGVECLYFPHVQSVASHLEQSGHLYDVVLLYRARQAAKHIDQVLRHCPRAKVIFDTTDLHYLRELRLAELENSEELLAKAEETKSIELGVIGKADCTIVLSTHEQEILKHDAPGANVAVVPLVLEIPGRRSDFSSRNGICYIGGFQHTPNVDAVLYFMSEVWPLLKQKMPHLTFYVVGSKPPEDIGALASEDVVVTGYVEDIGAYLDRCRLSVVPLRYGAGIKGKIGSSLSYGLPCVATPIAVEGMGMTPGKDVLIEAEPEAFAGAVARLHEDPDMWLKLSEGGLEFVRREYSFAANQVRLANIFSQLGAPPFSGTCNVCGFRGPFTVTSENFRENLVCPTCRSSSRQRVLADGLLRAADNPEVATIRALARQDAGPKILDTDKFSAISAEMRDCKFYSTSMYVPDQLNGSQIEKRVWNVDLMKMPFEEASFDIILTSDILEHVRRADAAHREIFRCLKPGGTYIFTVPYVPAWAENQIRVDTSGDQDVYLMDKEYHGDPLDPNGALVYQIFGRELYFDLTNLGFDVTFRNAPLPGLGIVSPDLWICRKPEDVA